MTMPHERPPALDRDSRLDEILVEYLEALETGTAPDRRELLARYPDLADDITAFLDDQARFDSLVAPLRTPAPAADTPARGPAGSGDGRPGPAGVPSSLGDYELLEEMARGGMGVVYKARQVSLNRTVALKMILTGQLASAEEVQRFRLEAEAAAGLDHPNIVPIYEIGEHQGQPYFSMKLIEGGNLSQHVEQLLGRPREAARLLAAVARAVHYAHQRGVLHRDLKPANILLAACGSADDAKPQAAWVPYVTDFGLAKRVEKDGKLTHSGAAVGTPSYMAPEQASGKRTALTTAADVYSLGAILYELLTGRPPFRADTPLNTLAEVLHREPVPPRSVRPGIDRDLETICLKCLHKDLARRYASAAALADDLDRYLAGEPILARPVGRLERLGRWCRRNVALTAAGALAAVGLAAALVISCLFGLAERRYAAAQARAADDLRAALETAKRHADEAQARAAEAERERARAEESFRQAHEAVNKCLQVSEDLAQVPGVQPLRRNLLATALSYYRTFLRQRGEDPALRGELAETYSRVALISSAMGAKTRALAAYKQALAGFQDLARAHPEEPRWLAAASNTLNNIGVVQAAVSQPAAARESVRQALDLAEQLVRDHPEDRRHLRHLARVYEHVANLDGESGDHGRALERARQARTLFEQLLCVEPRSVVCQEQLALCVNNLGVLYAEVDRLEEALRCYEEARALRDKLAAEAPRDGSRQLALAASYRDLGILHRRLGHRDEALAFFEKAIDLRDRLARDNPTLTQYQLDLAASLNDLGSLRLANGERKAALECHNRAIDIQGRLIRVDPNVASVRNDLARSHYACGDVLFSNRQYPDALRAYQTARGLQEKVVRDDPGRHDFRHDLASTLHRLGLTLGQVGRREEGLTALRQAAEHERAIVAQAPQVLGYRRALADHHTALAAAAVDLGRTDEAAAALLERRQLWPDGGQELYRTAADLARVAAAVGKGRAELTAAEEEQRRRCADLALDTLRQAVAHGFRDVDRLRGDPSLAGLRGRHDFRALLAGLGQE
jgi:tetratricopeptide (TPR) repeat protein/tRNA A-37 threonylcarbamoyl transferase component Bud32